MNDVNDPNWRNRFIIVNLVQIAGTVLTLLALLLWQTDYIVEGGSVIGFPLAFVGLLISFFGRRFLVKRWKSQGEG